MSPAGQRLGASGEVEIDRRELGKAHAERAENTVGMLYHAARARADRDATRPQVGKRSDRRLRPHDEEQRAGVHQRRHGKVDRLGERSLPVLRAADPVRGHEAELDLARLQAICVLRAGGLGLQNFDRNEFRLPLEYDLEGAALAVEVEGAVVFRGADSDCHIMASCSIPRNASTRAPR